MLVFRTRDHKRCIIKSTDTEGVINSVFKMLWGFGGLGWFLGVIVVVVCFLYLKLYVPLFKKKCSCIASITVL